MRKMLLMMLLAICTLSISAQSASNKDATIVSDIQYKSNQDDYVNERCKLDIYYSKETIFYRRLVKLLQYYRRFAYFLIFLLKRFELYGWNCPIRP